MIWVAVILGILVAGFVLVTVAYIALRCLQSAQEMSQSFVVAHRATLDSLERVHARQNKSLESVLDRFMALDFSLFKAYQSAEDAEAGGFVDPVDEEETGVITYTPSGNPVPHGRGDEDTLKMRLEEAQLLREDFGEEFFEKEDAR